MMGIGAQGNTGAMLSRNFEKADIQILPVWVAIDLNCFVELGSFCKNVRPIGLQPDSEIVNPAAGVSQDLNVWVAKR